MEASCCISPLAAVPMGGRAPAPVARHLLVTSSPRQPFCAPGPKTLVPSRLRMSSIRPIPRLLTEGKTSPSKGDVFAPYGNRLKGIGPVEKWQIE